MKFSPGFWVLLGLVMGGVWGAPFSPTSTAPQTESPVGSLPAFHHPLEEIDLPAYHSPRHWWIANHPELVDLPARPGYFDPRECQACHRLEVSCRQCHRFVGIEPDLDHEKQ